MKYLACIITFNPNISQLKKCINAILFQVNKLLIIDNNSRNYQDIKKSVEVPKIVFMKNDTNEGLSKSYNKALRHAKELEYNFLLILDQDTICSDNLITEYSKYTDNAYVCLTPYINHKNKDYQDYDCKIHDCARPHGCIEDVKTAINSGTLINLKLLPEDISFNENLFVDCVDWDFYLQLNRKNLEVARVNTTSILVDIGNKTNISIGKYNWFANNYSAFRLKIQSRDFAIFLKSNFKYGFSNIKDHLISGLWIYWLVLFEENKLRKIWAIVSGFIQGLFTALSTDKHHK